MKVGDLIECNGGSRAVILAIEYLYPRHPESPPRNFTVHWLDEPAAWAFGPDGRKVDAFAVKRVLSRANR